MSGLQHIPLESFHLVRGARFVDFAGWFMPVQYSSIIQEHLVVRRSVGCFDVSHMGEFVLEGPDSLLFLNTILTNDFSGMDIGQSKYSMLCDENGGVVDDLIVYRLENQRWLICVNAGNREKDWAWMSERQGDLDARLTDESAHYGLLALQGPESESFLGPLLKGGSLGGLKRFQHRLDRVAGAELWVSRTGYTGEDGFELYIPADALERVAEALDMRAKQLGCDPFFIGLGARDSLRLEAGYPLYGHELSPNIDPITAGLGWTVKFKKQENFVGKDALSVIKKRGPIKRVQHFRLLDRRIARQGEPIWQGEEQVGEVLSGGFSPVLDCAIGSALISVHALEHWQQAFEVRLRGKPVALKVVKAPIHLD